jgi:hypothetical protein
VRRREIITLLGGAAVSPRVAHGQQRARAQLIGVIMNYAESDPEGPKRPPEVMMDFIANVPFG